MITSRTRLLTLVLGAALLASGCQGAAALGASKTVTFQTRNDSGVTGTVTMVDVGNSRTRVEITADPAGNLDMPGHIHPGTCEVFIPQPKYPLASVINGVSVTVVPASFAELTSGNLTVNLHRSNAEMKTITACADLS